MKVSVGPLSDYALSVYGKMPAGLSALAFLAGGTFRSFLDGTNVKDHDLFFASHADWQMAVNFFRWTPEFVETTKPGEQSYPSFQRGDETPFNLIGFRFYRRIEDLASSFDFRCCGFAAEMVDPETVEVFSVDGAATDAADRVLTFLNHQHIDRVIRRMDRYVDQYGYRRGEQFEEGLIVCRGMPVDSSAGGY